MHIEDLKRVGETLATASGPRFPLPDQLEVRDDHCVYGRVIVDRVEYQLRYQVITDEKAIRRRASDLPHSVAMFYSRPGQTSTS